MLNVLNAYILAFIVLKLFFDLFENTLISSTSLLLLSLDNKITRIFSTIHTIKKTCYLISHQILSRFIKILDIYFNIY